MSDKANMISFDQLQEENKAREEAQATAAEEAAKQAEAEDLAEEEELEEVSDSKPDDQGDQADDPEGEEEESTENASEASDSKDLPDWMEEESDDSTSGEQGSDATVPVAVVKDLRVQRRELREELSGKDAELEQLRAENERLRVGKASPSAAPDDLTAPLKVPKEHEFETDEEYDTAMAKYHSDMAARNFQLQNQTNDARGRMENVLAEREEGVNAHLERAVTFVQEYGIKPDVYKSAELNVRDAVSTVHGDKADTIVDDLIAKLGKDSEKVMYYLGRNKSARGELLASLSSDPTGVKASIFLGEVKGRVSAKPSNSSQAPAPATQVTGDGKQKNKGALKRAYAKAHKSGNVQEAFDIKQKARADGVDTKDW